MWAQEESRMKHLTVSVGNQVLALLTVAALTSVWATSASAKELTVNINSVTAAGIGDKLGTIVIEQKQKGLSFKVDLTGIPAGEHGFHLHDKGDCSPATKDGKPTAALAAGSHYDPATTKTHAGPMREGHKGDLPFLTATDKGVNVVVSAPHLTLADVSGRALLIHAGGDNYTDHPENGGGMGRIACGVVPKE
jgi:superoxide dismutase, Cu-Zn family